MPPRRSSRSTRASVEPTEASSLPSKRKRGQTAEPNVEKQTEVAKPPSRTRRPTSTKPVAVTERRHTSTQSRGSLPDVAETDDEEGAESVPPVKKVRPSLEPQEDKDSELEEEKKPRTRRTASLAKRDKPLSANRNRPSSTRSGRSSRAAPVPAPEEEAMEEEGDEEETMKLKTEDNDVMKISDDEPQLKPKSRKTVASRKVAQPSRSQKFTSQLVETDQESGNGQVQVGGQEEAPGQATNETAEVQPDALAQEEEEEETSLFDPPPITVSSSLPQVIHEEPAGPKPRLVIHKMALVNFKSYAGRQEIGPFHKVNDFCDSYLSTYDASILSLSLPSSAPTVPESLIPLTLCSSFLAIAPRKCVRVNSQSSFTTLQDILTSTTAVSKFTSARSSTWYVNFGPHAPVSST